MEPDAFGQLLKRHRTAAGLSQEELAVRARVSAGAVGALERGARRAPYPETVTLLADALVLDDAARTAFAAAADRARSRGARSDAVKPSPHHNLPWQSSSFVGRGRELDELVALIARHSLVTVTGGAGLGKTRIAVEAGRRALGTRRDGVWFVGLAPLRDGSLIVGEIAAVLQIGVPGEGDPAASLLARLQTRRILLILDGCEEVLADAAEAARAIHAGCPHVTIVTTSREPLGVGGEAVYRLPPLALPSRPVMTAAEGRTFASLELFTQRAERVERRFVFSDERAGPVADICRRLEGIPLAIELAAARAPALGLLQLRARLNEHFGALQTAPAALPATLAWSYALLDEPERTLLRRLAIFSGGWRLEAAETVCPGNAFAGRRVAEVLASLVEKSLVTADRGAEAERYALLDPVRSFAGAKLDEAGERAVLARRHAEWLAEFAERVDATHTFVARRAWLAQIEPELHNARAALAWALGPDGDPLLGARIAGALRGLWKRARLGAECRRWVDLALARIDAGAHPRLAGRLWLALAGTLSGTAKAGAAERAVALLDGPEQRRLCAADTCSWATVGGRPGGSPRPRRRSIARSRCWTMRDCSARCWRRGCEPTAAGFCAIRGVPTKRGASWKPRPASRPN